MGRIQGIGMNREQCRGPQRVDRREVLRTGLVGFSGLTLPGLYHSRAQAAAAGTPDDKKTAIILVWLRGGCSHLDTWDPKPGSTDAYRSPYHPISTSVPGTQLTELLPRMASIADKYNILRSIAHNAGGHPAGSLRVLSGDPARADKPKPFYPDWMTVANFLRSDSPKALPNYVAINPVDRYDAFQIAGPGFLGPSYEAFRVTGDPSKPKFSVPNIGSKESELARLTRRSSLRVSFDRLRRDIDQTGLMQAVDDFESQAISLLTSPKAQEAFDLGNEPAALRDRYGRNQWGQQCLLARRLVEAGVDIVTTEFDGPLCGRVANWDDHAVNHHVFEALAWRAPFFDQAISGLIEDVYNRGLDRRVMVVITGEFGRTPRISNQPSSGPGKASRPKGTRQPGRDHWPRANSMVFAGGGMETGQVIGATDRRGEDPIKRRVSPYDFLATLYHHLGVDTRHTALTSFAGRTVPVLSSASRMKGTPVPELTSRT